MLVYRITTKKWSQQLTASGFPARWNSRGFFMIYAAESRSLACLENLVHRNKAGLDDNFKVMLIHLPEHLEVLELDISDLPKNWNSLNPLNFHLTQSIGDQWLRSNDSCVLKVPSVIIPGEFNYLINPQHRDFDSISLHAIEGFIFDSRLKQNN